jgi:hypothetical protein
MGIAEKIKEHKPKLPGLSKKEKLRYKEELKALAAEHVPTVVETLAGLVKNKNVPASARVAASNSILERFAGRAAKEESEANPEHTFDRMSQAQLLGFMCETIAGLSQESRSIIAEALLCAQRNITFDPRIINPDFSETEALKAEQPALPPLERAPKPKREPRR